eukprot:TRINITY_DN33140_c0_g1_i1.p1 TRINITY_DN33140_c0_g1~~TRINITY_DN33140_c0_g1_i1.p1  ORF type:complete len:594 (-),score=73.96 TRINITY_DN33140_c0_g1_i1:406-2187(-)
MPGVDTERVINTKVLETELRELICVFCKDLVNPNGALQAPCGHVFCTECILEHLQSGGSTCPTDKMMVSREVLLPLREANPIVYRMLGRTQVRCENFRTGCPWTGELTEVPAHVATCPPRHCKCCGEKGADLKRAKEMMAEYKSLVVGYKEKVTAMDQKIGTYKQTLAERDRQLAYLEQQVMGLKERLRLGPGQPTGAVSSSASGRATSGPTSGAAHDPGPGTPDWSGPSSSSGARGWPNSNSNNSGERSRSPYPTIGGASSPSGRGGGGAVAYPHLDLQSEPGPRRNLATLSPRQIASPPRRPLPKQPWKGGHFTATLSGHTQGVNAMAVAAEGTLYSASWDGTIRVWQRNVCVATFPDHAQSVNALVLGREGTLYSCGDDKSIKAWQDLKCVATLEQGGPLAPSPVKLAIHNETLYVAYYKGGITVFEGFKKVATLEEHGKGSAYVDIVVAPDGTIYYSGSLDHSITVYRGGAMVASLIGHTNSVYSMALKDDGTLYSLSLDDTIRVWRNNVCTATLTGLGARGNVLVGQDGVLYTLHAAENSIRAWRGREWLTTLKGGHVDTVVSLAQSPNGNLYSGDAKGFIKVWEGTD